MSGDRILVLTGFMGSGKSVVGRLVAERLGRRFVDMDEIIAERHGMSISDIFERHGEPYFRAQEAALCRELAAEQGLVIATGGGALVDEGNRRLMTACGTAVCLTAAPEVLWQRVGEMQDRPMLVAADRRARLEALLAARRPAYAEIPHQVDTTRLSLQEAADRVVEICANAERVRETSITVRHPGGSYPVFVTRGGLAAAGLYLRSRGIGASLALLTDDTVAGLWGDGLLRALAGHGYAPTLRTFPAGEQHKNLGTVEPLITGMAEAGLSRDATVVALGGGVTGDTAGLVAALYMRGVPLVQVPTTLLAMIDSSVGGKVAVDLPIGKNLVGAFKQPELVLIDVAVLETLPAEERRAGLAEAVKAGVIGDPALFEMLEAGDYDLLEVIRRAIQVKVDVVEADPYEKGRRAILNLGHTFAHAYETLSDYSLRHGDAVAIGMVLAGRLAAGRGLCPPELARRLESCLSRLGLPTRPPAAEPRAVLAAMQKDKKRAAGRLRFILPVGIGDVRVYDDVTETELLALLGAGSGS